MNLDAYNTQQKHTSLLTANLNQEVMYSIPLCAIYRLMAVTCCKLPIHVHIFAHYDTRKSS